MAPKTTVGASTHSQLSSCVSLTHCPSLGLPRPPWPSTCLANWTICLLLTYTLSVLQPKRLLWHVRPHPSPVPLVLRTKVRTWGHCGSVPQAELPVFLPAALPGSLSLPLHSYGMCKVSMAPLGLLPGNGLERRDTAEPLQSGVLKS